METKNQRFQRLSKSRLEATLEAFRLIANLSTSNYKRNTKQVNKIIFALKHEIDRLEALFFDEKHERYEQFDLLAEVEAAGGDPDKEPK